jgi:hypothetical protein
LSEMKPSRRAAKLCLVPGPAYVLGPLGTGTANRENAMKSIGSVVPEIKAKKLNEINRFRVPRPDICVLRDWCSSGWHPEPALVAP